MAVVMDNANVVVTEMAAKSKNTLYKIKITIMMMDGGEQISEEKTRCRF